MISGKLVEFFKSHNLYNEKCFIYFNNNITYYDYDNIEDRIFTGVLYKTDNNNILNYVHICVPKIVDDKTMLINIHEFVHAIDMYNSIGKVWINDEYSEVLSILFEKIYIRENPSINLFEYEKYLDECIKNNKKEYIIAYNLCETMIDDYNFEDINTLKKKVRKID